MKTYSTGDMTYKLTAIIFCVATQSELCIYINLKFWLKKKLHNTSLDILLPLVHVYLWMLEYEYLFNN